jgi:hypothetical protein
MMISGPIRPGRRELELVSAEIVCMGFVLGCA